MRIVIDNAPVTTSCRYCPKRASWSIFRGAHGWSSLCHEHLGTALKRLGLRKLEVTVTAEATATVDR